MGVLKTIFIALVVKLERRELVSLKYILSLVQKGQFSI